MVGVSNVMVRVMPLVDAAWSSRAEAVKKERFGRISKWDDEDEGEEDGTPTPSTEGRMRKEEGWSRTKSMRSIPPE